MYCNILQRTATHCNALQHTATHCNTLPHTSTHCNTLQHTATHCNALRHIDATLQHTATQKSVKSRFKTQISHVTWTRHVTKESRQITNKTHDVDTSCNTHSRTSRARLEIYKRDFRMDTGILCVYRALLGTYRATYRTITAAHTFTYVKGASRDI